MLVEQSSNDIALILKRSVLSSFVRSDNYDDLYKKLGDMYFYNTYWKPLYTKMLIHLFKQFDKANVKFTNSWLDLGCGVGAFSRAAATVQNSGLRRFTLCDISKTAIERCLDYIRTESVGSQQEWRVSICDLSKSTSIIEPTDIIVALDVLYYLDKSVREAVYEKVAKNARRVAMISMHRKTTKFSKKGQVFLDNGFYHTFTYKLNYPIPEEVIKEYNVPKEELYPKIIFIFTKESQPLKEFEF